MLQLKAAFTTHKNDPNAHLSGDDIRDIVVEDALNGAIIINQPDNVSGLKILGYDDNSTKYVILNINSSGNIHINGSSTIYFDKLLAVNAGLFLNNFPLQNCKTYADATLSGTPLIFTFTKDSVEYYFKAYPTKT